MTELIKYEAARQALIEARDADEVMHIRDQSLQLRYNAKLAKDRELEDYALEIRLRAERRLGEMIAAQPKAPSARDMQGNQYTGKMVGVSAQPPPMTLAQAGIDKNLAHRARTLASMTEKEFEDHIDQATENRHLRAIQKKNQEIIDKSVPLYMVIVGQLERLNLEEYSETDLNHIRNACNSLIKRIDAHNRRSGTWPPLNVVK